MHFALLIIAFELAVVMGFADDKKAAPTKTSPPKAAPTEESPELKKGKELLEVCRKLFHEGKQSESVKLATESIDIFVAPYPLINWVDIGSIETEKYRVVIHVNTTAAERAKVRKYIVRPYTFCVFSKNPDAKLLYVIDFEHGYDDGVLQSAALGHYAGGAHYNYGMIDTKADFTAVRDAALALIKKDAIKPSER